MEVFAMSRGSKVKCCEHCLENRKAIEHLTKEFEKIKHSSCQGITSSTTTENDRMSEMEQNYRGQLEEMRIKLNRAEQQTGKYKNESEQFRQRMSDMEQNYSGQLEQMRSELQHTKIEAEKCKNEYADFKKRMKYEVSRELDSSGTRSENIMNPCRESELITMYERMKIQSWGETRDILLRYGVTIQVVNEHTAELIKVMFEKAMQHVDTEIKGLIENACRVQPETVSKTASLQKIIQNFQIFFRHCDDDYYKKIVTGYVSQHCTNHPESYTDLAAECYKVATLMALHEPPLKPVWDEKQGQSYSWWPNTQTVLFPAIHKNNCAICQSVPRTSIKY